MIENNARGLLQNLITAPMIDGLPLAEGKKKVQKLSQVNQEWSFKFTMNTSTWFKKCFNQDFISVNIYCLQNMNYSFPRVPFEPGFHLAWKDAQLSLPVFQGFLWFTSMTLGDFSFCIWGLAETLLFSAIGGSDTCNFETLFVHLLNSFSLIPETILFFKQGNHFQGHENMLSIPVMTGKLTPLQNKKQSEK